MNLRRAFLWVSVFGLACHPLVEQEPELEVTVRCASPVRHAVDERLVLRGHLEPPPGGDLPLASQVAGRIVELRVHEGQRVQPGDVVASVDDLASRDVVRQSEATLAQASAAELNANATLARTQALVSRGIAARQELDDATEKAESEKQSVASSRAALDLARRTLGRVQVRAAFPGLVTRLWRGPGAIVDGTAATPIAQIAAASGAEFVADATERDLSRLEGGQSASVMLGSGVVLLPGVVRAVSNVLDPNTGLGVVRITLSEPLPRPLMGEHGRVTLVTRHREGVLFIPVAALRGALSDGAEVVVCAQGVASVRSVRIGYRDERELEVVSGLAPDERIALDHVLGLDNGTRLVQAP